METKYQTSQMEPMLSTNILNEIKFTKNKYKNVYRFALSALREELLERESERTRESERKRESEKKGVSLGILYAG